MSLHEDRQNRRKSDSHAWDESVQQAKTYREDCLRQLGRLYVALHAEDPEPALRSLVDEISDVDRFLYRSRTAADEARDTVACSHCGTRVAKDAAYCHRCGMPILLEEPQPAQNAVACSECGEMIRTGDRFCTHCGTPLPANGQNLSPANRSADAEPREKDAPQDSRLTADSHADAAVRERGDTAPYAPVHMKSAVPANKKKRARQCPECGATVSAKAVFCLQCGTRLERPQI